MQVQAVKLVYFSPTGTTEKVLGGIARGIDHRSVEAIDITRPAARREPLQLAEDELLVMGVPVYMGRVPALLGDWLRAIHARNTPAVGVVVYGNRVYDDALLELTDILSRQGCRPVAGAAFIGEHSFSRDDTPTAKDRPDAGDMRLAEEFGRKIRKKMGALTAAGQITGAGIPLCRPYRGDPTLWNVDFIEVGDACVRCGTCAEGCPAGAIDPEHSDRIDSRKCITCCACIRHCPVHARTMKPGPVMDASVRLHTLYKERKEPEYFL